MFTPVKSARGRRVYPSGLVLLSYLLAPTAPVLNPPRLDRGLELVYRGHITETSTLAGHPFQKTSDLEVRILVLESKPQNSECAILTRVRPREDQIVAEAAAAVTGMDRDRFAAKAAVTLHLVRVDARGNCTALRPPSVIPPFDLAMATVSPLPPAAVDRMPTIEYGMFIPLPMKTITVGQTWDVADADRPPVSWMVRGESVHHGSRCLEVLATQHSDGWDHPTISPQGWRRTDTILITPHDGLATMLHRRCEHRHGSQVTAVMDIHYDLKSFTRLLGTRYGDARAEIEAAYGFAHDPGPASITLSRIERYLSSRPIPTDYRDAVEAARRNCLATIRGDAVSATNTPTTAAMLKIGEPARDFVTDGVRLSAMRGKPVVLGFLKPSSSLTDDALAIMTALESLFSGKIVIIGLAHHDSINPEHLRFPILDGTSVVQRYGVQSFPTFIIIDSSGCVTWQFDGVGPEVGYLLRKNLEKLCGQATIAESP